MCEEQGWDRFELATSGGEDFELLFTGPEGLESELGIEVYPIGRTVLGNVLSDIGADAIKIGMLHSDEVANLVADKLEEYGIRNIVLDPVMVSQCF